MRPAAIAGLALALAVAATGPVAGQPVGPLTCERSFAFNGAGANEPAAANSTSGLDMLFRRHCRPGDVAEITLHGEVAAEALLRRYCDPAAPHELLPASPGRPASLRCHALIRR